MNTIKAFQHYYTASQYGIDNSPGFQTHAMSSEINVDEKQEIARLGNYEPPRDLPSIPKLDNINEIYPIAYRNIYLDNGRLVIARVCYVGSVYDGRPSGNYFSHSLLIENLPNDIWPIDLFEWDGWKSQLNSDEDIEKDGYILPSIEMTPNLSAYSFGELQEFINERDQYKNILAEMIKAVLMHSETSRSIVIREEFKMNSLFWIACIQKSFSPLMQSKISCSSYQFDSRSSFMVNATYGETDFILDEASQKYSYYSFDFIDNNYSTVDEKYDDYANIIALWISEKPDTLKYFHKFSKFFNYTDIDFNIVAMLNLFRISIEDKESLAEEELINILDFITIYTKNEFYEKILMYIKTFIDKSFKTHNVEYIEKIIRFFIDASIRTNNQEYRKTAHIKILNLYDKIIFNDEYSTDKLETIKIIAKSNYPTFDKEYAKLFLSNEHVEIINRNILLLDDKTLSSLTKEIVNMIYIEDNNIDLFRHSLFLNIIQMKIIDNKSNLSNLDWIFSNLNNSIDDMAKATLYICNILNDVHINSKFTKQEFSDALESFSKFLTNSFNNQNIPYYNFIKQVSNDEISWGLLDKEWRYHILMNKDKGDFYKGYWNNILKENSNFARDKRSIYSKVYWNHLSDKEKPSQATVWINSGIIDYIEDISLLSEVFQVLNNNISFVENDNRSDKLVFILENKSRDLDITLEPNNIILRQAIFSNDFEINLEELKNIKKALVGLGEKKYKEFIRGYLKNILINVMNAEEYSAAINAIVVDNYLISFLSEYKKFISSQFSTNFEVFDKLTLLFWTSLTRENDIYKLYDRLLESNIELLIYRISKLDDSQYNTLKERVKSSAFKSTRQKGKINKIIKEVEENKDTFMRRFFTKLTFIKDDSGDKNGK